jgi:transposase
MLGTQVHAFAPLTGQSLDDLVPADHFYRFLDRMLDLSFVRGLVHDCYSDIGRRSIDPVVFFKLQLVMFFDGIRSERQLLALAADRLSVRWYLGYDLEKPLPDHSSLTRIRDRYGLPIFKQFFEHVVELCITAGLVWGKELIFDATKVRANADIDTLRPRFYVAAKQHLTDLFADSCEDGADRSDAALPPAVIVEETVGQPTALPVPLSPEEYADLAAENAAQWRLLEQHRLDPDRPPRGTHRRLTDFKVSTTDPDAAPMSNGKTSALGYHDHYVVDGGKARIILAALVTPADVMENTPMPDLLSRVRFRWKLHPKRAIGDTTYGTVENVRFLEEQGVHAYVPLTDFKERGLLFGQSRFTYDDEGDRFVCPNDAELTYVGDNVVTQMRVYRARPADCQACPLQAQCTDSKGGRTVTRHFDEAYRDRVRAYHGTPEYAKAYRKRQVWIEPLFGEAKQWHGLRQFRLRGLDKVNIQAQLVAAGQNLKRWLRHQGWGRWFTPDGEAFQSRVPTRLTWLSI